MGRNPGKIRIIPARAGFTHSNRRERSRISDHPRSRGVYPRVLPLGCGIEGSSPLARGLPSQDLPRHLPRRIIPARAGFTDTQPTLKVRQMDHPRSRGVYFGVAFSVGTEDGSSPLARGLHKEKGAKKWITWIIPARAGFTQRSSCDARDRRDHPRSRGVYHDPRSLHPGAPGSSPLARGLHTHTK